MAACEARAGFNSAEKERLDQNYPPALDGSLLTNRSAQERREVRSTR
jgi:hypothetical protein